MAVNESNTIQYTVSTSRVTDGTTLYWKTTGNTTNSDIVGGNTGSITITNNRALFNVTIDSDANTDGAKTLGISLLTGSLSGTTVVTTPNLITVNDTSITPAPLIFDFISVAGGGAGGAGSSSGGGGGGGGAGGYISSVSGESSGGGSSPVSQITAPIGVTLTITVGAGGVNNGTKLGSNTSITAPSGLGIANVTSNGGGGGAFRTTGASGGSGGGGGGGQGFFAGGSGTTNQGYAGGSSPGTGDSSGGGGGASAIGLNGVGNAAGKGGDGVQSSISGTATYYAGGGGGGGQTTAGTGGLGGGANGAISTVGFSAVANTGGGGGGGPSQTTQLGGNGGSGIVIISYDNPQRATGGTITTSGGKTIHTFNSSGTLVVTG
jgi:hypothetical protein